MSWATVSSRSSRVRMWYCRPNSRSSLVSCSGSSCAASIEVVNVLVQVRVDELQLRRAVLVEERDGRAVLDRLLKVVDGNVVAENLLRPFLAGDQRRAGEGEEQRLGQSRAHVQRQRVVLAAVRLVREHDHVGPVAQHLRRLEFLDKREDIAVISAQ